MDKKNKLSKNDLIVRSLQERAKELRCMYEFEELFKKYENKPLKDFFEQVELIIPPAFQFPDICHVMISFDGSEYGSCDSGAGSLCLQSPVIVDDEQAGFLKVCYTETDKEVYFLREEKNLLNTIARRIGRFVFYRRLRENIDLIKEASETEGLKAKAQDEGCHQSYWVWRKEMAELIAEETDPVRFGVKALYVIGSTKNGKAGPKSDIDLLAHCVEDDKSQQLYKTWIEGWGRCLAYAYKEMTGIEIPGSIIDLHIITDTDIKKKTSFAAMLSSLSNTAKLLKKYRK